MSPVAFPIAFAALVGIGVLASNPHRRLNQAFFASSLLVIAWLIPFGLLIEHAAGNRVLWLRLAAALGAWVPSMLWWIRACSVAEQGPRGKEAVPWIASSAILAGICFTRWYIPIGELHGRPAIGPLQPVYIAGLAIAYTFLLVSTVLQIRRLDGIARIEVQTILMGGSAAGLAGLLMTSLGPLLGLTSLPRFGPTVVILFYGVTAWAISTRRIFEARTLFLGVMRWITVILILGAWLILWERLLGPLLPGALAQLTAVASVIGVYLALEEPIRRVFSFGLVRRRRLTTETRHNLLIASREIAELQPLKDRLESILMEWSGGAFAELLCPVTGETGLVGRGIVLRDPAVLRALAADKWATPESLERRRPTADQQALLRFLREHQVHAIAARPAWSSGELLLAVCLGAKRRGQPYTYPECQDLLEWTDLAEAAIARSMLTLQAKEAEHIATVGIMGASIAHEIRNPLVALSATAELLEEKHDDPEFRRTFSSLIDREVGRIKTISEQLRRLSPAPDPQLVRVRLSQLIRECVELVQARAAKQGTELIFPSTVADVDAMADAGALRQVVLNLLGNALDAVESKGPDGRIHVVVNGSVARVVLIDVSDNGKGISPQQRKRLFLPFSSDKTNGFGLGLATSAKLMRSLHGTISVVDREGPGATFRLTLQCPPVAVTSPAMS